MTPAEAPCGPAGISRVWPCGRRAPLPVASRPSFRSSVPGARGGRSPAPRCRPGRTPAPSRGSPPGSCPRPGSPVAPLPLAPWFRGGYGIGSSPTHAPPAPSHTLSPSLVRDDPGGFVPQQRDAVQSRVPHQRVAAASRPWYPTGTGGPLRQVRLSGSTSEWGGSREGLQHGSSPHGGGAGVAGATPA